MPIVKLKAEENYDSAKLLILNGKFASSIHCSYYACFQMSMHIICNKLHITYVDQSKEADKNKGSHKYTIGAIYDDLKNKNILRMNYYDNTMGELKYLRKKADYLNIKIRPKVAKAALDKATNVLSLLKKEYSL